MKEYIDAGIYAEKVKRTTGLNPNYEEYDIILTVEDSNMRIILDPETLRRLIKMAGVEEL